MASPWGKIDKVETTNFQDIMSEEYARGLQSKENKKLTEYLRMGLEDRSSQSKEKPGSSKSAEKDDDGEQYQSEKKDTTPEDVMKIIQEDPMLGAGTILTEYCDSDELIAHVLQAQFDSEYNEELKRLEKSKNKQSKISVSFKNYERHGDNDLEDEDDYDDEHLYDNMKGDWDRFETNEKKIDSIPKCGFKVDEEGGMVTKHDAQLCGVRNACRVMSFPPEFPTGDAGGFDMKLSNSVFNQLKRSCAKKSKKSRMHDRKENIATAEMGVDEPTRLLLYKLINNQILEQVNGIISTGKEALILHANSDASYTGDLLLPRECAIKIFKTTLNEFKQRDRYIKDDYRFKDRFSKQNNRVIINMWAEKEMHNMMRMQKVGINCPDVVILKKHILVMSFIGKDHLAAPKLKDARLSDAELSVAYEEVVDMMYKMYNEAKLVHADLSEYNILWYDGKCWFIDVAQSVEPGHPSALEFLMRDCDNIISFFTRRGLPNIKTKEELFEHITSLNAQSHNTAMLERIHMRGASVKEATLPNPEEIPEEFKPISYPFDLAWEKTMSERQRPEVSDNKIEIAINESADALRVLAIQKPVECEVSAD